MALWLEVVEDRCDYADLPHSGGGTDHGPAVHSVRGYDICDKCYTAMRAAEIKWDEAHSHQ